MVGVQLNEGAARLQIGDDVFESFRPLLEGNAKGEKIVELSLNNAGVFAYFLASSGSQIFHKLHSSLAKGMAILKSLREKTKEMSSSNE